MENYAHFNNKKQIQTKLLDVFNTIFGKNNDFKTIILPSPVKISNNKSVIYINHNFGDLHFNIATPDGADTSSILTTKDLTIEDLIKVHKVGSSSKAASISKKYNNLQDIKSILMQRVAPYLTTSLNKQELLSILEVDKMVNKYIYLIEYDDIIDKIESIKNMTQIEFNEYQRQESIIQKKIILDMIS